MNGFMYPSNGKKVIDLGVGTSFNVSSYAGYEKFTTANFFVECESYTTSDTGYAADDYANHAAWASSTKVKSYSNGVLTSYYQAYVYAHSSKNNGSQIPATITQNFPVHAYLIK